MAYTVRAGDTLGSIAKQMGVSVTALAAANGIANPNRISIGQVINPPGSAAPAAASGYSMDEAMSAYGFVFQLANSVPQLKGFLDQAIRDKWTADRFQATIESSPWWMQNADTVRNLAIQQATEPGTYNQNLTNAKQQITLKAQQLGRSIDDATAQRLALQTLSENFSWDDQRLSMLVTNNTSIGRGDSGGYLGQAANYHDHMTKVAQDYGVAYTGSWLDAWVNDIESGRNSLDSFESVMRARAKAAFPQFANQIDAGMTIRDIADPYIGMYAQTLEVPETQVTLKDPAIQKALAQTGQDGTTQTSMPMWQFQRTLKDDPRYDRTKAAKDDAFAALNKIGKDFGFVGAGA